MNSLCERGVAEDRVRLCTYSRDVPMSLGVEHKIEWKDRDTLNNAL